MASPPPPYANVTGISRAVMKDSPQETFANYDGNARPGELVVNLDVSPPTLYIGNSLGNLNQVTGNGGGNASPAGNTNDVQFNSGGSFAATGNFTFTDGISGGTLEIGPSSAVQLDGNGTVVASNLLSLSNLFVRADAGLLDLRATTNVIIKSDNANNQWVFDSTGNLTIPGSSGGFIKTISNASIGIVAVDNGTNNPAQLLSLNAGSGNATSIISAYATNATIQTNASGSINSWIFSDTGYIQYPIKTYSNLPAATTPGIRAFISDANLVAVGNFGNIVSGGGSNTVPVWSDGTNWLIG